jgi:hypothetical protein
MWVGRQTNRQMGGPTDIQTYRQIEINRSTDRQIGDINID